ncbi:mannose-1-phosphate guanylyltransferase [Aquimarina macrocephali]|uniref:mannose-1-phosphate guanylyltransferase n=1 Tax=Aquimarina macrocephali TaxID=666563 RepID=UPI0004B81ECF|nr:sugar phosphate nucleotidyltransferase [Aquimarina macrocephali]
MNKIINVVLSGGSGTRLWPLSRQSKPKQFLKIFDKKSLFQHTITRNKSLVDDFMLLTNIDQENQGVSQVEELNISLKHKIIEPVGRNTAPAIALAAMSVDQDDILFVTPSDHMVNDAEEYKKSIKRAITLANKGFLVTFGIIPEYPETGYGYIESNGEDVVSFREKPDYKTAISFIEKENFYWNSGMFCFKAGVFLTELKKYRIDIFEASKKALDSNHSGYIKYDDMMKIPDESIDYAVFEKSNLIKTVKSEFQWTDLGSFDSLISYFNKNNIVEGISKIKGIDNLNSYSIGKKDVYGIGVSDLTVVDTQDCILVLPNQYGNRIKELHSNVKERLL